MKNSGKRRQAFYVPPMTDEREQLAKLPHSERIRSRKLSGGVPL